MLNNLPTISELDAYREFKENFNICDKVVLEVGGCLIKDVDHIHMVKEWHSIDPLNERFSLENKFFSDQGYVQILPYKNHTFDYIFSCNAFHHINFFEYALEEMYRVLKPNGILFSSFGPIWSAPDGHHLENIDYNNEIISFWEKQYIPDWYHLIYSPRELVSILESKLDSGFAKALVNYIYFDNWINRLAYDDYFDMINKSPFKVQQWLNITEFGYERKLPNYINRFSNKAENWIKSFIQSEAKYKVRDIKIILKK